MWLISYHSYIMKDISTVCWAHTGRLLPPCMHQLMEQLLLVSKLMRGTGPFHFCPPLPRYTNTWDVNTVLLELGKHTQGQDVSQAIVIAHSDVTVIDMPFQVS